MVEGPSVFLFRASGPTRVVEPTELVGPEALGCRPLGKTRAGAFGGMRDLSVSHPSWQDCFMRPARSRVRDAFAMTLKGAHLSAVLSARCCSWFRTFS